MISTLQKRFDAVVWNSELDHMRGPRRWGITLVRLIQVLAHDLAAGEITMRAMGLVYTSLLSLVPLLALAFSLLKAFGMNNAVRPMLERFLAPLGERAQPLVETIAHFVENVQVGVLGIVGLVILLYSVISLIQKIESGCNAIWEVRSLRSLGRRFTEYLSVLIVGPLVVVAALSMTATLSSSAVAGYLGQVAPFGEALYIGGHLMPYIMYSAAFTFLYAFMPNTHVHVLPALGGGLLAGILWQTASLGFTTFAANAGNINAIYSGFAILILLLIWLYVSWLIMLTGCRVAYLLQHQDQLTDIAWPAALGNRRREELALLIATLVAHRFLHGDAPWRVGELARHLHASRSHIYSVTDQLVAGGILVEAGASGAALMPRQDIGELYANDIIAAVRADVRHATGDARRDWPHTRIAALLTRAENAQQSAWGRLTLRELAMSDGDHRQPDPADMHAD